MRQRTLQIILAYVLGQILGNPKFITIFKNTLLFIIRKINISDFDPRLKYNLQRSGRWDHQSEDRNGVQF